MKKHILLILISIIVVFNAWSQKNDLIIHASDRGLYIEHKVAPKESFYAIGRLYNVSPKFLASYNKIDISKGLQIDQKLKIPMTDTNFTQKGGTGTPVYFKPDDKQELATIAKKYNVSVANLQWWNSIKEVSADKNKKLIIGFLLSKEMPSITIRQRALGEQEVIVSEVKPDIIPAVVTTTSESVDPEKDKKQTKKEAEAEIKAEKKVEKVENPVVTENMKIASPGQSYFRSDFDQQMKSLPASKNETVTSGIFKTTSGWTDLKYYMLMDDVAPGTIIKVINPTNNKAIYAKVLGAMAGIRQNEGYSIRISNAAAAALEISEADKFIVKINY
jgi:LysM repeat protein